MPSKKKVQEEKVVNTGYHSRGSKLATVTEDGIIEPPGYRTLSHEEFLRVKDYKSQEFKSKEVADAMNKHISVINEAWSKATWGDEPKDMPEEEDFTEPAPEVEEEDDE